MITVKCTNYHNVSSKKMNQWGIIWKKVHVIVKKEKHHLKFKIQSLTLQRGNELFYKTDGLKMDW